MIARTRARLRGAPRRSSLPTLCVAGLALAGAQPVFAQPLATGRLSLGGVAAATSDAGRLDATSRLELPWLSLHASGGLARADHRMLGGGDDWRGGGDVDLALFAPRLGVLRPFAMAQLERPSTMPRGASGGASLGLRLSPARGRWGAWSRVEAAGPVFAPRAPAGVADSMAARSPRDAALAVAPPRVRAAELGMWHGSGPLMLRVAARSGTAERRLTWLATEWQRISTPVGGGSDTLGSTPRLPDSVAVSRLRTERLRGRWSALEGSAEWVRPWITLDAVVGARPGGGAARAGAWGHVGAAVRLGGRVALRVAAGSEPELPGAVVASRRFASAGLALTTARFRERKVHAATRAAASAFTLAPAEEGRWTLTVRAPHARVVEVAGDFTAWRPVRLVRAASGDWTATLAIAPGPHHVNLRIDGEAWLAPPGLPAARDDFAGAVGVLLVPDK